MDYNDTFFIPVLQVTFYIIEVIFLAPLSPPFRFNTLLQTVFLYALPKRSFYRPAPKTAGDLYIELTYPSGRRPSEYRRSHWRRNWPNYLILCAVAKVYSFVLLPKFYVLLHSFRFIVVNSNRKCSNRNDTHMAKVCFVMSCSNRFHCLL